MQPLSPKKYIETKVRSLPIHKCYINDGWKEAGLANIVVCRRHVNNNLSGAVYLVDLKCLGVKDTIWFFNEAEDEMTDRFLKGNRLQPVDYEIAHNIIYAGHDFALDYEIKPHKDFATTRFVLEEDTDSIPFVDIAVGEGPDSRPHLIEHTRGQYSEALAKLKKIAGEGNYTYGIMDWDDFDEDDEDDKDDDDLEDWGEDEVLIDIRLEDVEEDGLTFNMVRQVVTEDLENLKLLEGRNEFERIMCTTELLLRNYQNIAEGEYMPEDADMMEDAGWETRNKYLTDLPEGIDKKTYHDGLDLFKSYSLKMIDSTFDDQQKELIFVNELPAGASNPFFLILILESNLMYADKAAILLPYLHKHNHITLVKLVLAFYHLLNHISDTDSQPIIESDTIRYALPAATGYDENELCIYYAIQTLRHSYANNLPAAIANYDQLTETIDTEIHMFLITTLFRKFLPLLSAVR